MFNDSNKKNPNVSCKQIVHSVKDWNTYIQRSEVRSYRKCKLYLKNNEEKLKEIKNV